MDNDRAGVNQQGMQQQQGNQQPLIVFQEQDNYSFEDSERFEEDSEVSWASSDGILTNQSWRGWAPGNGISDPVNVSGIPPCLLYPLSYSNTGRYSSNSNSTPIQHQNSKEPTTSAEPSASTPSNIPTLLNLSTYACAKSLTFESIDEGYRLAIRRIKEINPMNGEPDTIPEKLLVPIIQLCFPASSDDIRIYSCLANGNADEFNEGENLYNCGAVRDVFQIGYLLSATVSDINFPQTTYYVSLRVDRCRIISCDCSCQKRSKWCGHIVAVCLYRIGNAKDVHFRPTIMESVNELSHYKLKQFTQYLIYELPTEYLPIAQKMLDQIKCPTSEINQRDGAPDPTDGGHDILALWALDDENLTMNIQKLLIKYCHPAPLVHCDVNFIASSPNPITGEYQTMLKPLRSREPEGMWNLISIAREMLSRRDENAVRLLRIITEQCISNGLVLQWWYFTKLVQSGRWTQQNSSKGCSLSGTQLSLAQLCDEVVSLWKSVALNPTLTSASRQQLASFLQSYHRVTVNYLWKIASKWESDSVAVNSLQTVSLVSTSGSGVLNRYLASFDLVSFPGFYTALQCCLSLSDPFIPYIPHTTTLSIPSQCDLETLNFNPIMVEPVIPKKRKSRKKKSKKRSHKSNTTRQQNQPIMVPIHFDDESSLKRNVDAACRNAAERQMGGDEESTESGQESDVAPNDVQGSSMMPTTSGLTNQSTPRQPTDDIDAVLAAAYQPMDRIEVRFAECEALSAHGFVKEATEVALSLTKYIVENLTEQSSNLGQSEQNNDSRNIDSQVARCQKFISTLEKALYIAHILRATGLQAKMFEFVLSVLQIPKYPLVTKFQQVKLYYLEAELVLVLQQIQMGPKEVEMLRSAAVSIQSNIIASRGVPSISLVYFIFDKLAYGQTAQHNLINNDNTNRQRVDNETLAFDTAVAALGFRLNCEEHEYPMLSESIRRQKSDLSFTLIMRYKDSDEKLYKILDKLLDVNLHKMYSNYSSNAVYFYEQANPGSIYGRTNPRQPYGVMQQMQAPLIQQRIPVNRSISVQSADSLREEVDALSNAMDNVSVGRISGHRSSDDGSDSVVGSSSASSESAAGPSHIQPNQSSGNQMIQQQQQQQQQQQAGKQRFKKRNQQNAATVTLEAHVSNLFELAKRIEIEAGGGQNAVVFALGHNHQMAINAASHRRLRMCSLLTCMYALGLHNSASSSWKGRTYSQQVPFINLQVKAVGVPAIELIRHTWQAHLTPVEVLELTKDIFGSTADGPTKEEAAKLAVTVLSKAHILATDDTNKTIENIRNYGTPQLVEAACIAIGQALESQHATQHETVFAEVLFLVAELWYDLYCNIDCNSAAMPVVSAALPFPPHQPQFYPAPPIQNPRLLPNHINPYPNQFYYNQQPMHMHPNMMQMTPGMPYLQPQCIPPNQMAPPHLPEVSGIHQSHSAPQLSAGSYPDNSPSRLVQSYTIGMKAMEAMEKQHYERHNKGYDAFDNRFRLLFHVSSQLGPHYLARYLDILSRVVQNPFLATYFIQQIIQIHHTLPPPCNPAAPPFGNFTHPPPPARQPYNVGSHNLSGNKNSIIQLSQNIRNYILSLNWNPLLANLYERTVEVYFSAISYNLNHPRVTPSEVDEVKKIYQNASTVFVNQLQNSQFAKRFLEELHLHIRHQKGYSKDDKIFDRYISEHKMMYHQ